MTVSSLTVRRKRILSNRTTEENRIRKTDLSDRTTMQMDLSRKPNL